MVSSPEFDRQRERQEKAERVKTLLVRYANRGVGVCMEGFSDYVITQHNVEEWPAAILDHVLGVLEAIEQDHIGLAKTGAIHCRRHTQDYHRKIMAFEHDGKRREEILAEDTRRSEKQRRAGELLLKNGGEIRLKISGEEMEITAMRLNEVSEMVLDQIIQLLERREREGQ
jgi:hypothetical protein